MEENFLRVFRRRAKDGFCQAADDSRPGSIFYGTESVSQGKTEAYPHKKANFCKVLRFFNRFPCKLTEFQVILNG